jgi:hypothetical protein
MKTNENNDCATQKYPSRAIKVVANGTIKSFFGQKKASSSQYPPNCSYLDVPILNL